MKKFFSFVLIVAATSILGSCAPLSKSQAPTADSLAFSPPQPEQWTLENGLTVFFMRDSEIPVVKGSLYLRAGTLWEPDSQNGTMSAMGVLLRDGGAGALSGEKLDRELETLAAVISSGIGEEFGKITFSCLKPDLERVFGLYSDVLLRPRFDESRLHLVKVQSLEGIKRRKDDPGTVASIAFDQAIYGDSPYGRQIRTTDIQKVSRAAIIESYHRSIRPEGALLALSGDLTVEEARHLVQKYLGSWRPAGESTRALPQVKFRPERGLYFLEMPFSQATIIAGQQGVPRLTPDRSAIEVFNEIFGAGGFGSRLVSRIREELGLSYVSQGMISPGPVRGKNVIYLQTKSASSGQALIESLEVLRKMQHEEVMDSELQDALNSIINSFVFRFDRPAEVADRHAQLKLLGFPDDNDSGYISRIGRVKATDVIDVARNRWNLDDFVIVVVGDKTAYNSIQSALNGRPDIKALFPVKLVRFDEVALFGE